MESNGATMDAEDVSLPDGLLAVVLFHYGIGALVALLGLVSLIVNPVVGVLALLLGGVLWHLGRGLRTLRRSTWRQTIALHGIDAGVGLLFLLFNGIGKHVSGVLISSAIIVYLYSQRNLYHTPSE